MADPYTRSPRHDLIDIGSKIPQIVVRAEQLRLESSPGTKIRKTVHDHAYMLLVQIAELHKRLEAWLFHFESLYDGPLFWSSSKPTYAGVSQHDPECQPIRNSLQHQLCFRSGPVAGILVTYWSFRLKLWMVAADLRHGLETLESAGAVEAMHEGDMDHRRDHDSASKTALMILEAMPYLSSCFEGNVVLQAPLKIVEEFHRTK